MKLTDLTGNLQYTLLQGTIEKEVTSLIYFSEKAGPGAAFFAIPGRKENGILHAGEAVRRGAEVLIVQEPLPESVSDAISDAVSDAISDEVADAVSQNLPGRASGQGRTVTILLVENVRRALALMSIRFYQDPCSRLYMIGITGTKGKTSTAYMLRAALEEGGIRTGLIGTVENGWEGHFQEAEQTTPQSSDVQRWCRDMEQAGCRAVVMEVSSQGLMQSRVEGIRFDLGIFTNLTPDHIGEGEHEDFADYVYWKSKLFRQCRTAVIHEDTPLWRQLLTVRRAETGMPEQVLSFGQNEKADCRCRYLQTDRKKEPPGTFFLLEEGASETEWEIRLSMPGLFNGANAAGAAAAARAAGICWPDICRALRQVRVPGRVEPVDTGGRTRVLVDYAHNGTALRQLLADLRACGPSRLIVVFGCGGCRDRSRRREMGRAAAELADLSIVTSDNPRTEDPQSILREITASMEETEREGMCRGSWQVICDRASAIREAVRQGGPEDLILIAGKGHETWQYVGKNRIRFDDREIVRSIWPDPT